MSAMPQGTRIFVVHGVGAFDQLGVEEAIKEAAKNQLVTSMPSVDRKMLIVLANRLREIEGRYVPADARLISTEIT